MGIRPFILAAAIAPLLAAPALAQDAPRLGGAWSLDRTASEIPRDIGFTVGWIPSASGGDQSSATGGSGRGGRGSGGGNRRTTSSGPLSMPRESYDDARRVQLLTSEARTPPARLTVVDVPAAVTMTNEQGRSRTFHPTGAEEALDVDGVPLIVTAKREGERLVVVYRVEQDRQVRYTYSPSVSPSRLVIDVQFLDHGAGDKARLVYEPAVATTAATPPPVAPTPPGNQRQATDTFDQRPGAELRGLTSLGILVEDLGAEAVSCGLNHAALEAALAKRLSDAGFVVRRNSDDDTYLYVNVMTNAMPNGTCVSRYDAFLYTHATAKLSYHDQPVLVQVSLIHRGGIGSTAPSTHAAAVTRGLTDDVDLFVTQIRNANK